MPYKQTPMKNILLVEDDECLRESLKERLTVSGYPVTCAANGEEAITAVDTQDFDLVATDIFMPRKGGLALIMHVRSRLVPCKVLAFSGGGTLLKAEDYLVTAKDMKVDATLKKPFTCDEFLTAIKEVLE